MSLLIRTQRVLPALQRAIASASGKTSHHPTSTIRSTQFKFSTTPPTSCVLSVGSNRLMSSVAATAATTADLNPEHEETKQRSENRVASLDYLEKLLHGISLNVQRTGRVLVNEIHNAERLVSKIGSCSSNHALLMLRCCGSVCTDDKPEDRSKTVLSIWKMFEDLNLTLDVSHYNALLRAHVENEYDFEPVKFLAWMENEKKIHPNRVTYQLLVTKYCQTGDISGATAILEYMKQKEMTVNENVFHSLIMGHCRNGDFESAEGMLTIMSESGIDVGTEAYTVLLSGMARGGKSYDEVRAKLVQAGDENIVFSDHEIFRVMIEFLKAGNKEAAEKISETLPKIRGFFQEMRNAIPKMIFAGETELPFQILSTFKTPTISDQTHSDAASRDHGLFFLRVMVKNEYPPEKILEVLEKLDSKSKVNINLFISRLLEVCIEYDKQEYGRKLATLAREKHGNSVVHAEYFVGFVRSRSKFLDADEIIDLMVTMEHMNIQLPYNSLSNDLFPKLFKDLKVVEPAKVISQIVKKMSPGRNVSNWIMMMNASMQYLFNREDKEGLYSVARMVLNISVPPRPTLWNASIARSYLATDELDWFVAILYSCSNHVVKTLKENDLDIDRDTELFSSLAHLHSIVHRYKRDANPDQVLIEVLQHMKKVHLGIPETTANILKPVLKNVEGSEDILDEMVSLYANRTIHLTKNRIEDYIQKTRGKLNSKNVRNDLDNTQVRKDSEDFNSVEDLERIHSGGQKNLRIVASLMDAYARDGLLESMAKLYTEIREENPDFNLSITSLENICDTLIEQNRLDDALALFIPVETPTPTSVLYNGNINNKKFLSSFMTLGKALAKADRHDDVIKLMNGIVPKEVIIGGMPSNVTGVMDYYADQHNTEMVHKVYEILQEKGLIIKAAHSSPVINVLMNVGDDEAAVAAFERMTKDFKKLPQKFKLMERLIETEDMEKMQRVLDASISIIGEEKSLYDLAMSFLALGKTSQARKLLETPGLRYNHDKVTYICNFFTEKHLNSALENFVYLTQPVFACDREFLYSMLVNVYSSNSAKMSDVWVQMQEEGFIPSDDLKRKMAEAFKAEKKPVPFHVNEIVIPKSDKVSKSDETKSPLSEEVKLAKSGNVDTNHFEAFSNAIKAEDYTTAAQEINRLLKEGMFVSEGKTKLILKHLNNQSAWPQATEVVVNLLERGLDGLVTKHSELVSRVVANATPEDKLKMKNAMKSNLVTKFSFDATSETEQPKKSVAKKDEKSKGVNEDIENYFQTFNSAIEAGDFNTATQEINSLLKKGNFVPANKSRLALELIEKHAAWDQASDVIVNLLERELDWQLVRNLNCVRKVVSNASQEDLNKISGALKNNNLRSKFGIDARISV